MTWRARLAVATALAAAAAAAGSASTAVAQVAEDDPRLRLVVRVDDRFVRAVAGDYCLRIVKDGELQGTGCMDGRVDVRRLPRIRVSRRGELELRPTAAASEVRVFPGRPPRRPGDLPVEGRSIDARPVGETGTRWRLRTPRRRFTYLRVLVRYGSPQEYTSFYIGVRKGRPRCRR